MAEFLVDLPPRATKGMQYEREGFGDAAAEIASNQAMWGEQAGVTRNDAQPTATQATPMR